MGDELPLNFLTNKFYFVIFSQTLKILDRPPRPKIFFRADADFTVD